MDFSSGLRAKEFDSLAPPVTSGHSIRSKWLVANCVQNSLEQVVVVVDHVAE